MDIIDVQFNFTTYYNYKNIFKYLQYRTWNKLKFELKRETFKSNSITDMFLVEIKKIVTYRKFKSFFFFE